MHRSRFVFTLALVLLLTASVSMTSCGGGGAGGTNPDLVLLGFNVPNLSGIPLNQPLIFTFSANINPATITPDSLRVVGDTGPFFESTVVDGNLVALVPTVPNFADYSDAGFAPDTEYTVSLTEFPAVTTIESTTGKPLLQAASFTFRTLPAPSPDIVSNIRCNGPDGILGTADDTTPSSASFFVEPRRAIRHGTPPSLGGVSDDEGCLQNSANPLYVPPTTDPSAIQAGSGPGARLLCMQNEGSPRIIEELSTPRHNQQAVGTASAVQPGFIDLPAIRIKVNEPLDPLTIEPFFAGIPVNVQLWRVALKDGSPVPTGPDQIPTNKPIVVQETEDSEIILVPAGPVPQGTFLVNITPAVKDLPGCPLRINDRPDPTIGGYDVYEATTDFQDAIQPGYRIYFKSLEVPDTPLSIIEQFTNNLAEWGDNQSDMNEPGLYTSTVTDTGDLTFDGNPLLPTPNVAAPELTRLFDGGGDILGAVGGQSTTALWNQSGTPVAGDPIANSNGYKFLNIPTLGISTSPLNPPTGRLVHVRKPYRGSGEDGSFDSGGGGTSTGLSSTNGSIDSDGIYEYTSFLLRAGDTISVTGDKPILILCQGEFRVEGTITLNGSDGNHGFDTDGSDHYTNAGAVSSGGRGGAGGPGGGAGGHGAEALGVDAQLPVSAGNDGGLANTLFDDIDTGLGGATIRAGGGVFYQETVPGANDGSQGGGGGGFQALGTAGSTSGGNTGGAEGGSPYTDGRFTRALAMFKPDRAYQPGANVCGGGGGAGGSLEDDNGASEDGDMASGAGDDGGAGGGGAGGAMWVIADTVRVLPTAVIQANGGNGGNAYGPNEQLIDPGPDGSQGGGDDIFVGLGPGAPATGTGQGGPGGGGAGGAICLIGATEIDVDTGATFEVNGGQGGTSDDGARVGGNGGLGYITLITFTDGTDSVDGTFTGPNFTTGAVYQPTVRDQSTGQSDWVDLFTPTADFAPSVNGQQQFPTHSGNFQFPGAAIPGFLETPVGSGGGGQVQGVTFDVALEFQGADFLNPEPGVGTPTTADGLTQWFDRLAIDSIDNKRFFRWRWRFWTVDDYGQQGGDPANLPVPTVFDLTIPFVK